VEQRGAQGAVEYVVRPALEQHHAVAPPAAAGCPSAGRITFSSAPPASGCSTVAAAPSRRAVCAGSCSGREPGRPALELTCSAYCCMEQSNLAYLRIHQGRLRARRVWEVRGALLRGEGRRGCCGRARHPAGLLGGRPALHVPPLPGVRPCAALLCYRARHKRRWQCCGSGALGDEGRVLLGGTARQSCQGQVCACSAMVVEVSEKKPSMVLHVLISGVHEVARIGLQALGAQQPSWGCALHEIHVSIAQIDFLFYAD
jgi:hypothetical protein